MSTHDADPVRVLIVAVGGYGYYYLRTLLDEVPRSRARLAGVVDPEARLSRAWPEICALGVPVCDEVEEFFGAGHEADLAVIASPIQHHVPQSLAALAHGAHVLCDKPLGATIQEAEALVAARNAARRFVMIGYQWSWSVAIQELKRDIQAGLFGSPTRFSAICCWPRDEGYYRRNDWAGCLRDPRSGRWVLDGPANNAMAHSLHNLLYLGGRTPDRSATPITVRAELYRAYPVASNDTAAVRLRTREGVEILFCASHVTSGAIEPRFRLEFDRGCVVFDEPRRAIVARTASGTCKEYGAPDDTPQFEKLFDAIRRVREESAIVCGPEAAAAQTLAIDGMHESAGESPAFPARLVIHDTAARRRFVPGLDTVLLDCFERGLLPSETGAEWAVPGTDVDLTSYRWFPAAERAHASAAQGAL